MKNIDLHWIDTETVS